MDLCWPAGGYLRTIPGGALSRGPNVKVGAGIHRRTRTPEGPVSKDTAVRGGGGCIRDPQGGGEESDEGQVFSGDRKGEFMAWIRLSPKRRTGTLKVTQGKGGCRTRWGEVFDRKPKMLVRALLSLKPQKPRDRKRTHHQAAATPR